MCFLVAVGMLAIVLVGVISSGDAWERRSYC